MAETESSKTALHCTRLLADEELVGHLERRRTLLFRGLGREWQQIEKQVERLGFGEIYFVSQLGSNNCSAKVSPAMLND